MTEALFVEAEQSQAELLASSIAGSLIGTAAADALGWVTEFVRGRQHLRDLYGVDTVVDYRSWHKTSGGRFYGYRDNIGAGEYSDDTQLTLAVARSLNGDGSLDPVHFTKQELPLWLDYSRGAGSTITKGAQALRRRASRWDRNFFPYSHRGQQLSSLQSGANGAAMRVAPIALANHKDPYRMELAVWKCSIATHGHPRDILGAILYAEAVRRSIAADTNASLRTVVEALSGYVAGRQVPEDREIQGWLNAPANDRDAFMNAWTVTKDEVLAGLELILSSKPGEGTSAMHQLGCFEPETKGSGVGTVLAALLIAMLTENDFENAIVTAINQLGSDTDTIGGFVGGILGARLGYTEIPVRWAEQLQDYEYLMRISTELTAVAEGRGLGGKALLPAPHVVKRDPPDLLDLLKAKRIEQGQAVYHRLFGYGKVRLVEPPQTLRRAGYKAYFAWVDFDVGQSCKFRFIKAE
jgi:ADP-ribosylglycohydrolase